MIANLLIVGFLLAMAYWWSTQGLFSAFLHLVLSIVAGSLAIAFWEPLAYTLLSLTPILAPYAWGLSLLLLFIVIFGLLRVLSDKVVPKNVHFMGIISQIGGGACGVAAGIIISGLTIIGLGFLPLGVSLAGYQPWQISADGQVTKSDSSLWVGVDRMASNVFTGLSNGAFSNATPLVAYHPDFAKAAILFRLRLDENASVVAVPGSVTVQNAYSQPTAKARVLQGLNLGVADALGDALKQDTYRLVVVDTLWRMTPAGTYDSDSTLRVPSTQVRLGAAPPKATADQVELIAPIAFAREENAQTGERYFYALDSDRRYASSTNQEQRIAWVFMVPEGLSAKFLTARNLHFDLPADLEQEPEKIVQLLGEPVPVELPEGEPGLPDGTVGGREGIRAGHTAASIQVTNQLPRPMSTNEVVGIRHQDGAVVSGKGTAKQSVGSLSKTTRLDTVYQPGHLRTVRLQIQPDQARSLLGAARAAAASLQGVWLEDDRGNRLYPIGYAWMKSSGEQEVMVNPDQPIRSARELPAREMGSGDQLYLYFRATPGVTITSYQIGESTTQDINLKVQ